MHHTTFVKKVYHIPYASKLSIKLTYKYCCKHATKIKTEIIVYLRIALKTQNLIIC